jgi:homoserine O-acetyltransferase
MSPVSEIVVDLPAHEIVGPAGAPVVVALGGISATRHVCASASDAAPGWWNDVVGVGRAIDTQRYQVLGLDFLDGGCDEAGLPERIVTTQDQARALAAVLDELAIDHVHAVVGASYGGMVALAFAELFPDRVTRLVVVSAAHRPHPMITALRGVQRRIVELGLRTGTEREALALARQLAMTTYRSAREFTERFDAAPLAVSERDATFAVDAYLTHHGDRFAARWSAARFLALSLSNDLHSVEPANIRTPTVLVAADDDAVVPRAQMLELERGISAPCVLTDLHTTRGHDGFLTDADLLAPILEFALESPFFSSRVA